MNHLMRPIGVFDSGMGGLTVLRALKAKMPQESFIYLGDTARLPYGTKSVETVRQYATQMARILVERDIKALVVACNTATTAALSHLKTILSDMPVMGVIAPGASAAALATKNQKVMVLATETTVASLAYQHAIHKHLPHALVTSQSAGLLVALAEEGMVDNEIAQAALQHYLAQRTNEDTVLLGCTHFPVFRQSLQKLLPNGVQVVDSAEATALAVHQYLKAHGLFTQSETQGMTHYLVTDLIARFEKIGEVFLGEPLNHQAIEQVDI